MSFQFPPIHDFPPFYTEQINQETNKKQLSLWSEIVLNYCRHNKIHSLDLLSASNSPLFNNTSIQRRLAMPYIQKVIEDLVAKGNAQWEKKDKERCQIIWRTLEEWADIIFKWVVETGQTDTVLTVYELIHGTDTEDTAFHELEESVMLKALGVLEKRGKAKIFQGSTSSDSGVKFFS